MTCIVYGLKSTRNDDVRYVGQTTRSMSRRLTQHMYYAKHRITAVHHWIMREVGDGFQIYFVVFVPDAIFNSTEQEVIAECRSMGYKLLNHTEGGGGVLGHTQSSETKQKKSEAAKAYWDKQTVRVRWRPSEEQKKKIGIANTGGKGRTGQKHSEETRRKMREWAANNRDWLRSRNKGRKHTPDALEKMSAARRVYWENKNAAASV